MNRSKKPDAENTSGDEFHDLPPIAARAIFEFERGQGAANSRRSQDAKKSAEDRRVAYESALCILREAERREAEDREAFAASLAHEVGVTTFGLKCLAYMSSGKPMLRVHP